MEMLKYLRLAVCVACIAAFASGCGGGGGGTTEETPVMECPQGQVGTYPDCTAPPPTDAELIADAQDTLAGIVSDAQTRVQTARSNAADVRVHDDATDTQIANANANLADAETALANILAESGVANTATTPAQANGAVANARTALGDLITAQAAVASILSAVNAVAEARRQREADELAQTGGSSLIKHLRDNRKVSDAVLGALTAASLLVGQTGATTGTATYPYHKGTPATQYPRPANTDRGVLGVTVRVDDTDVTSNSQTGKISGSGRLSSGFDLKDGNNFATVYTDISVDARVRQKTGNTATDSAVEDDTSTMDTDERYQYIADDDYLLAGIWLDDSATDGSAPVLRAFAFGSQPLAADHDFCTAADVTNTTTLSRACGNEADRPFNTIAGFVDENESTDATYTGGVSGAYFAGGKASHFNANVSLTATFVRGTGTDATGSKISGEITNISAGGNSVTGSIDLKEQSLATLTNLSSPFEGGEAAGVIEGHAYTGNWKGQFFGMRATKTSETGDVTGNDPVRTTTTTYSPDEPDAVAGSFFVERQTVGEGNAAFIGAFGAKR